MDDGAGGFGGGLDARSPGCFPCCTIVMGAVHCGDMNNGRKNDQVGEMKERGCSVWFMDDS